MSRLLLIVKINERKNPLEPKSSFPCSGHPISLFFKQTPQKKLRLPISYFPVFAEPSQAFASGLLHWHELIVTSSGQFSVILICQQHVAVHHFNFFETVSSLCSKKPHVVPPPLGCCFMSPFIGSSTYDFFKVNMVDYVFKNCSKIHIIVTNFKCAVKWH